MKKIGVYLLYGGVFAFAIALIFSSMNPAKRKDSKNNEFQTASETKQAQTQNTKPVEKVQVFAFHSSQRCYSCILLGKYAKETVEELFASELESGKIEFREINLDLPENKEIAKKFKAAGSSLFINGIVDGQDNIKQDAQVWRLLSNKQKFSDHLAKKLREIIGESEADAKEEI